MSSPPGSYSDELLIYFNDIINFHHMPGYLIEMAADTRMKNPAEIATKRPRVTGVTLFNNFDN